MKVYFLWLSLLFRFGFSQINLENLSLNRIFETASSLEDRLHLGKTQIKFGFSLGLHYLCPHLLIHYIFYECYNTESPDGTDCGRVV